MGDGAEHSTAAARQNLIAIGTAGVEHVAQPQLQVRETDARLVEVAEGEPQGSSDRESSVSVCKTERHA